MLEDDARNAYSSSLYRVRHYQCISYSLCFGRLCAQLDFIVYVRVLRYVVVVSVWSSTLLFRTLRLIGRLCTELDNINAQLLHRVSVVCARSSTLMFARKLSDFMRSSSYRAQRSKKYEPIKLLAITIRIFMKR